MQVGQQDVRYRDIIHRLQDNTCIGTSGSTCIGIGSGIGIGTGAGAEDVDYCLTIDGLVRFKDKIYVLGSSELKKVILREFHVKPYLGHPGYQKILTIQATNHKLCHTSLQIQPIIKIIHFR